MTWLPYGRQEIDSDDVEAVAAALREPLITTGPQIEAFEDEVAAYLGARHVVALSSGTAALHAAASAIGLTPDDDVVVPAMTFCATANCVRYLGAYPFFVDIDPATWNLDVRRACATVASLETFRAIIATSFAGLPVDIQALRPAEVPIIEDACHALGAERNGKPVGAPGGADITCFSLHPVKAITTGEGGLAVTEHAGYAETMRAFRNHGIEREMLSRASWEGGWYYEQHELGFNYRMTDFQAALGRSQLRKLDEWIERRGFLATEYSQQLFVNARVELPPSDAGRNDVHAHHLFVILLPDRETRLRVYDGMRAAGIGVQVHYIPVYRLPYYHRELGYPSGYREEEWPVTEDYYSRCLSLPIFPGMTEDDVERVVRELRRLLADG